MALGSMLSSSAEELPKTAGKASKRCLLRMYQPFDFPPFCSCDPLTRSKMLIMIEQFTGHVLVIFFVCLACMVNFIF